LGRWLGIFGQREQVLLCANTPFFFLRAQANSSVAEDEALSGILMKTPD